MTNRVDPLDNILVIILCLFIIFANTRLIFQRPRSPFVSLRVVTIVAVALAIIPELIFLSGDNGYMQLFSSSTIVLLALLAAQAAIRLIIRARNGERNDESRTDT